MSFFVLYAQLPPLFGLVSFHPGAKGHEKGRFTLGRLNCFSEILSCHGTRHEKDENIYSNIPLFRSPILYF